MSRVDEIVQRIAQKHLSLWTLEARGRDHLDFSEQSVVAIKEALVEAFKAGKEDVLPVHLLTEDVSEWNDYANRTCGFRANLSQKIYVSEWGNSLGEYDSVVVQLKFENKIGRAHV